MDEKRMNEIEKTVAVMQSTNAQNTVLLTKLETSIDKLSTISGDISKILAVHEERFDVIKGLFSDIDQSIETHSEAQKLALDSISKKHEEDNNKIEDRVDVLEKYKWYIVGALGAITILFKIITPFIDSILKG